MIKRSVSVSKFSKACILVTDIKRRKQSNIHAPLPRDSQQTDESGMDFDRGHVN